jgi:hypothetical protein
MAADAAPRHFLAEDTWDVLPTVLFGLFDLLHEWMLMCAL